MSATAQSPQVAGAEARRLADWVFRVRELGIVAAFALLMLVTAIIEPRFVTADSLRNLALNAAIFAILAAGQTLVIITRNVDLSVGSVLGLAAFMAGDLLSSHQGLADPGRDRPRDAARRRVRRAQRRPRDVRPGARARRHARHAVRLPRRRVPVDERPPGQRRDAAGRVPEPRHRLDPRHPDARPDRARRRGRRRPGAARLPRRARAVRDRLEPRGRAARRRPLGAPRVLRLRALRRARRPRRGCCSPPGSARSTRPPAPATS